MARKKREKKNARDKEIERKAHARLTSPPKKKNN